MRTNAERLRIITPLILGVNTVLLTVIVWFMVRTVDGFDTKDREHDEKFKSIDKDISCMSQNIAKCCKESIVC